MRDFFDEILNEGLIAELGVILREKSKCSDVAKFAFLLCAGDGVCLHRVGEWLVYFQRFPEENLAFSDICATIVTVERFFSMKMSKSKVLLLCHNPLHPFAHHFKTFAAFEQFGYDGEREASSKCVPLRQPLLSGRSVFEENKNRTIAVVLFFCFAGTSVFRFLFRCLVGSGIK